LKDWLKFEWLVRTVYALFLSIVFVIVSWNPICFVYSFPILTGAFQIRGGKLFSVWKVDVLIEDICRAFAIFLCTFITIKIMGGI
jgi:hypothetical protein